MAGDGDDLRCSFCNKSQKAVKKLIAGPTVYICDECVDICLDIIAEDEGHEAPPRPHKHVFTVDELQRMAQAGVFRDRIELVDGEVFDGTSFDNAAATCVRRLTHLLPARLQGRAVVSIQNPLVMSVRSRLQPAVCVLAYREDFYALEAPRPSDVLIAVDVDEGLPIGRFRQPLYARAGVPEAWRVDLDHGCIEVCRDVAAGDYQQRSEHARGATLAPAAFPDVQLSVDEIVGPA